MKTCNSSGMRIVAVLFDDAKIRHIFFAEGTGGDSVSSAEGADQMALVGKAAVDGDLHDGRFAGSQLGTGGS